MQPPKGLSGSDAANYVPPTALEETKSNHSTIDKVKWAVNIVFPMLVVGAIAGLYNLRDHGWAVLSLTVATGVFVQILFSVNLPETPQKLLHHTSTRLLYGIFLIFWQVFKLNPKGQNEVSNWAQDLMLIPTALYALCASREAYDSFQKVKEVIRNQNFRRQELAEAGEAEPETQKITPRALWKSNFLAYGLTQAAWTAAGVGLYAASHIIQKPHPEISQVLSIGGSQIIGDGVSALLGRAFILSKIQSQMKDDEEWQPLKDPEIKLSRQTKTSVIVNGIIKKLIVPAGAVIFAVAIRTDHLYLLFLSGALAGWKRQNIEFSLKHRSIVQIERDDQKAAKYTEIGAVGLYAIALPVYTGIQAYRYGDTSTITSAFVITGTAYGAFIANKVIKEITKEGKLNWAKRTARLILVDNTDILGYTAASLNHIATIPNIPHFQVWLQLSLGTTAATLVDLANISEPPKEDDLTDVSLTAISTIPNIVWGSRIPQAFAIS